MSKISKVTERYSQRYECIATGSVEPNEPEEPAQHAAMAMARIFATTSSKYLGCTGSAPGPHEYDEITGDFSVVYRPQEFGENRDPDLYPGVVQEMQSFITEAIQAIDRASIPITHVAVTLVIQRNLDERAQGNIP